MKLKVLKLTAAFLLFAIPVLSQNENKSNETYFTENRQINLDNDSKQESLIVEVQPNTKKMRVSIKSSLTLGALTIEFYDSEGKKIDDFKIKKQLEKKEFIKGNIIKSFESPKEGKWKIKIIPEKASGVIKVETVVVK